MSGATIGTGGPSGLPVPPRPEVAPVTVVCLGNTLMADDGIGAATARELRDGGVPPGCVLDVRMYADMSLVGILRASSAVVVVDAIDAGSDPGAIFRFTPDQAGITEMRSHNTHGMGLGYAVSSARMLGVDPPVVVFGVQVGDVRPLPDTLSPAVEAAVPEVASLVREEVAALVEAARLREERATG